jgi:hypothetical protein
MSTPERQDDAGEHGYGAIPAEADDEDLEHAPQHRPEHEDDSPDAESEPGTGDQS